MQDFIDQYLSFYYVSLFLFVLGGLFLIIKLLFFRKSSSEKRTHLSFKHLNQRFEEDILHLEKELLLHPFLPKPALKLLRKLKKKENKEQEQKEKSEAEELMGQIKEQVQDGMQTTEILKKHSNRVYVLSFVGNIKASAVEYLRDEITFLLQVALPSDEIVIRLTSPGGGVSQYGLASSQLARLKQAGLRLTVCVDTVAASGGYMMAAVADHIVAAPFSVIGSIGVVAGLPNFNKVLQKNDVDYLMFTAGKYKRTVTSLGEVTEEGKQKFQEDLQAIHDAFKHHIVTNRQSVDIENVATGEYWLATQAQEKGLVDEIMTSDDYIYSKVKKHEVIEIKTVEERNWIERNFQSGTNLLRTLLPNSLPWSEAQIPNPTPLHLNA